MEGGLGGDGGAVKGGGGGWRGGAGCRGGAGWRGGWMVVSSRYSLIFAFGDLASVR